MPPDFTSPRMTTYSVSELNHTARMLIETGFPLLWVEGEISNLSRPGSGHYYFSLKDEGAQVRCAWFRPTQRGSRIKPENGRLIQAFCRVTLYEARGEYQLVVQEIREAGEGLLQKKFEELKQRLLAEGLFDQSRKRSIPTYPRQIAVITSGTGAAIHDILTTLKRRFPTLPIVVLPVPVQGNTAAPAIVEALQKAGELARVDTIILARGGGSLEDLWPFNEEIVARAIEESTVPVISGVGHETDFTIADLVADFRAATPTAAAEAASPDMAHLLQIFRGYESSLTKAMIARMEQFSYEVDQLSAQLIRPDQRIRAMRELLPQLYQRLKLTTRTRLDHARLKSLTAHHNLMKNTPSVKIVKLKSRCSLLYPAMTTRMRNDLSQRKMLLAKLTAELDTVSPLATLARGYTIASRLPGEELITSTFGIRENDRIRVRFHDGTANCLVEDTNK